jgi:hypothetical protein
VSREARDTAGEGRPRFQAIHRARVS